MLTKNKSVYYCEHCSKHGLSKHAMEWHEKHCSSDPKHIPACWGCKHLREEHKTDPTGAYKVCNYFTCGKTLNQVHHIVAVRKRLPEKHPDHFDGSVLMPRTCEHFEAGSSTDCN